MKPAEPPASTAGVPRSLRYLFFERSEDGLGMVSFDAVASVRPQRLAEVQAEADAVILWARTTLLGPEGPLDEGGAWDHERIVTEEGDGWHSLALTLTGDAAFARLFEQAFPAQG